MIKMEQNSLDKSETVSESIRWFCSFGFANTYVSKNVQSYCKFGESWCSVVYKKIFL